MSWLTDLASKMVSNVGAAGAGFGVLGSILGGMGNMFGMPIAGLGDYMTSIGNANAANAANRELYEDEKNFIREREDLAYQRELDASSTSIQRLMADAKAAGVNPMAVFGQMNPSQPSASVSGAAAPKNTNRPNYTQFASLADKAFDNNMAIFRTAANML